MKHTFLPFVIVFSSLLSSESDISRDISKLKEADASQKYIIMNKIKEKLAKMNTQQRSSAIKQIRQQTGVANTSMSSSRANESRSSMPQSIQGGMRETTTNFSQPVRGASPTQSTPHQSIPQTAPQLHPQSPPSHSLPQTAPQLHPQSPPSHSLPQTTPHPIPQSPGHGPGKR